MPIIETTEFNSAEELMNYLRRGNSHWWEPDSPQISWIFRGHWNSEWKLVPSAWREEPSSDFSALLERLKVLRSDYDHPGRELDRRWVLQANAEYESLCQFAEECDALGFDVPELDDAIRATTYKYLSRLSGCRSNADDLPEEALEVAALAQHHGIPTRLLDWTDDPVIGAFFAVDHHFRREPPSNSICVFALHRKNLQAWNDFNRDDGRTFTGTKQIVGRRARNSYLRSQGGHFVAMMSPSKYLALHHKWPDLEHLICVVADELDFTAPVLKKLILPVKHADSLLQLIDREGVNRARLMPTLDNVAATIRSRWLYQKGQ